MDYEKIVQKRNRYQAVRDSIPELTLQSYEKAFEIEYTHNSTAIEGNTLTLIETKVLLEDGISIGGKHLRELYEAVNHQKAYLWEEFTEMWMYIYQEHSTRRHLLMIYTGRSRIFMRTLHGRVVN